MNRIALLALMASTFLISPVVHADDVATLKKEIELLKKEIVLQTKEIELLRQQIGADIKGIVLRMRSENDNLDRGTRVYATVKVDGNVVAKDVQVAAGEFPESTDMADVAIPFDKAVPEGSKFTIELNHPGINGNSDPHWRMTCSVIAQQSNGKKRATSFRMNSSKLYETKGVTAHLNFVGGNRSSGEMTFTVE
jgi:hypothetical protein